MVASNKARVLNIGLRIATLSTRFFLIFFLARFLDPAQLGLYGLLTATVGYSLYLLGFDFYTFTTREVLKRERQDWGEILKNQAALSLVLYAIFMPLLSLIFLGELLPWELVGWFFVLLVLEHLNQELSRLLITISEQLLASIMLFLRQGSWAIAIIFLMNAEATTRSLNYVFGAWVAGAFFAALIGFDRLRKLDIGGWQGKIDWKWILSGLKISIPLLLATLAIRALFTLDRYWLQSIGGLEVVGSYVLFMGIGGALMSFLDAGVFSFSYPGLIGSHQKGDSASFREGLRLLSLQTVVLSIVFAAVSLIALPFLLSWIGNPLYLVHQYLYIWVLAAMTLYALGMIPHYALYAQGLDRPIIRSHISSLFVFVGSTWFFLQHWPSSAVPLGLCAAFALIFSWKMWAFLRLTPKSYIFARV